MCRLLGAAIFCTSNADRLLGASRRAQSCFLWSLEIMCSLVEPWHLAAERWEGPTSYLARPSSFLFGHSLTLRLGAKHLGGLDLHLPRPCWGNTCFSSQALHPPPDALLPLSGFSSCKQRKAHRFARAQGASWRAAGRPRRGKEGHGRAGDARKQSCSGRQRRLTAGACGATVPQKAPESLLFPVCPRFLPRALPLHARAPTPRHSAPCGAERNGAAQRRSPWRCPQPGHYVMLLSNTQMNHSSPK